MSGALARLFGAGSRSFRHGTHPDAHKETTSALAIEHMPLVDQYVLPLSQHGGAPAIPCVEAGQRVKRGATIAKPDGFRSVALHAPVAGSVRGIELRPHPGGGLSPAIVLVTDHFAEPAIERAAPCDIRDHGAVLRQVQAAGIVGMGGAAYPAHAKMRLPEGKRVDVVVLNGAECEPYLTSDHRLMLERPEAVVDGLTILMEVLRAPAGRIGVEVNKPDAIDALRRVSASDPRLEVVPLAVKYPEGAKQMLIEAVTGTRVPLGGRSMDAHVTIHNVASSVAIHDACREGLPLVERVVTVTGKGVGRPANVRVPIGTPLRALLEHCGGLLPETRSVVVGGAMMGQAQSSLEAPVIKGITGVIALVDGGAPPEELPCIRCGKCLEACAMFLNPSLLASLARHGQGDALRVHHVDACFECGSCAFVCPSHIPLTELIRSGKRLARRSKP